MATGWASLDLNLYSSGTNAQTFNSSSAAFITGTTEVINLSAYLADLPTILDTMGYIYAGDSSGPGNGTALGLWGVTRGARTGA